MSIKEILKITKGTPLNLSSNLDKEITNFELDSRNIKDGDCFIAINKGNDYIKNCLPMAGLVITEKDIKIKTEVPIIKVISIVDAISKIARQTRLNNRNIPVIAVTGSVGKTTTKELISSILSKKYNVLKSSGNENNHIGLPKTLMKLNNNYDVVILEMGMNHLKEIDYLSSIALPDIGVITNIGTAHIGNLKSQKNIFKAKMEITNYMNNGLLIVNGDDKYLSKLNDRLNYEVLKCGLNNKNDLKAIHVKEYNDKITFALKINNQKHFFIFNIPNTHILNNVLLAIKVGLLLDVDIDDIIDAIKKYKPLKERMNIINLNTNILIDDCYNASYESIKGSIEYLNKQTKHKIAILGDILELGEHADKIHKKIAKDLSKIKNIEVLLVGTHSKVIKNKLKKASHFNSNEELIKYIKQKEIKDTIILIKGSHAMNLKEIKEYLINI